MLTSRSFTATEKDINKYLTVGRIHTGKSMEESKYNGIRVGDQLVVLNRGMLMPLGLVLSLLTVIIWFVWTGSNTINDIHRQIHDLSNASDQYNSRLSDHITAADTRISDLESRSWLFRDMVLWITRLEKDNPTLKVPEPVK